ncbi:MAG: MscL family protein [bacterium]
MNAILKFVIVAFALFLVIRQMNKMMTKPAPAAATPEDIKLLREIRDALKEHK